MVTTTSDTVILGTIIAFMLILAFVLPSIVSEFGDTSSTVNTDINGEISDNGFTLLDSLITVFAWDVYGALPSWVNLIIRVIEIIGILIVIKIVRGVGS